MSNSSARATVAERMAQATPALVARRIRSLSDRSVAWLFIAPTILLLLAINIFPLFWTIYLSFTNYKANRPNAPIIGVGTAHYQNILSDPDIWHSMQATAHFVIWTVVLEALIGFGLAYLIDRKFRGHGFWTTIILLPMMLSPAVVGNFWKFLFEPQIGLFNYAASFLTGVDPSSFQMLGEVSLAPWSIVIVDVWMWTPYVMVRQMVGEEVPCAFTGGNPAGDLGTDPLKIRDAIESVWSEAGVAVFVDLGGAEMNAEMAVEMLDPGRGEKVRICNAPVVEGAVIAASEAAGGSTLEQVCATAEELSP